MSSPTPPKFILRFLKWFCKPEYHLDIEGDLLEFYERNVEELGRRKANLRLYKDVFLLFRPSMMRSISFGVPHLQLSLLANYFKVSWRSIMSQKQYSFFNVAGLVFGITCFILVSIFVSHERSFDRFYENVDNIYHVYEYEYAEEAYLGSEYYAVTPAQMASALMADYPEVEYATTLTEDYALLTHENRDPWYEKGLFTDSTFFKVFSHPKFNEGSAETAFLNLRSIILTQSLADKMFPSSGAMGQTLTYKDEPYLVTGVVMDPPLNSTFQFSFIANLQDDERYLSEFKKERWDGSNYYTFFSMNPSADPESLEQKLPEVIEKYWTTDGTFHFDYLIQPFAAHHFNSNTNNDLGKKGSMQQIILFLTVSILILILAGINYVNLSIARSMIRIREVGIRKSFGAGRRQLVFQFLLESELLAVMAFVVSLVIAKILLPYFGMSLDRELTFNLFNNFSLLLMLFGIILLLGLAAGIYPAWVISSASTTQIIKGRSQDNTQGKGTQQWLVIFQYSVSIAMVICTIIIYQQFQFISNKELGFEQDQILTLEVRDMDILRNYNTIKAELLANPDIIGVGTSQNLPHDVRSGTTVNDDEGGDPGDDLSIYRLRADHDFIDIYQLEVVAGRSLPEIPVKGKNLECLINESAAEALGFSPQEAIGQILTDDTPPSQYRTIIGVVKDFHQHGLHLEISPMLVEYRPFFEYISVKANSQDIPGLIEYMDKTIKKHSEYPVNFRFMDDRVNQLYAGEQKKASLFSGLSLLTIIIATLGLYGLAALNAHQKVKEIGIRKVLGASISSILIFTSGNFLKLIAGGFLISIPIAWYAMQQWLENYAYRIDINWLTFALVGLGAMLIALLTVGSQSIKAAIVNPVDCIRD